MLRSEGEDGLLSLRELEVVENDVSTDAEPRVEARERVVNRLI